MSKMHGHHLRAVSQLPGFGRALGSSLVIVALVGAFYVLREVWKPVTGSSIYLMLLAGALVHLFHGRDGHGGHAGPRRRDKRSDNTRKE